MFVHFHKVANQRIFSKLQSNSTIYKNIVQSITFISENFICIRNWVILILTRGVSQRNYFTKDKSELYNLYICLVVIARKYSNCIDRFSVKKLANANFLPHIFSKLKHVFSLDDRDLISFNS